MLERKYEKEAKQKITAEDKGTFDIGKLMIKTLSLKKAIVHIGFWRYQIADYELDFIAKMNFED